jgi:VTC domain
MDPAIARCLEQYSPIGLEALNGKAAMLERIDNKYIMPAHALKPALEAMSGRFDVLDIDGRRAFAYATGYFDDAERRGYYDHHQRRRKRCKARVRHYLDAGFSYFEVKLNEQRSTTAKHRMKVRTPFSGLDEGCMDFVRSCYRDSYGDEFDKLLVPVIRIEYERITLVAREGGERLTIDTAIQFHAAHCSQAAAPDMFIVETKSARGNGIADKIFRALHLQPTRRVSKYCIGMAVTGQVVRHNGFLPALRKLQLVEAGSSAFPQLAAAAPSSVSRITSHVAKNQDRLPDGQRDYRLVGMRG